MTAVRVNTRYQWLLVLGFFLWPATIPESLAQSRSVSQDMIVIPKMDDPQVLDGRVADPAWEQALSLGNVRLRYNPREGNDFYIVFNEQLNTNRYLHTPHRLLSDNRTLLVKYTHTFGW